MAAFNAAFRGRRLHRRDRAGCDGRATACPAALSWPCRGSGPARLPSARRRAPRRGSSRLILVEMPRGAGRPCGGGACDLVQPARGHPQSARAAALSHVKLQIGRARSAYHTALTRAVLAGEGRYESHLLAHRRPARAPRNSRPASTGEGADCQLRGGYMARGSQHVDNTTVIDHAVPRCESREVYKGVLDDTARGVFQGRIIVPQGCAEDRRPPAQPHAAALAQGRDRYQARTRDLCRRREVQLTGRRQASPRPTKLFYLRSRGPRPQDGALALIVEGFMGELLERDRPRANACTRLWPGACRRIGSSGGEGS